MFAGRLNFNSNCRCIFIGSKDNSHRHNIGASTGERVYLAIRNNLKKHPPSTTPEATGKNRCCSNVMLHSFMVGILVVAQSKQVPGPNIFHLSEKFVGSQATLSASMNAAPFAVRGFPNETDLGPRSDLLDVASEICK